MNKFYQNTFKSIILMIVSYSLISCGNYSNLNGKLKNSYPVENSYAENNTPQNYQDVGNIFWEFGENLGIKANLEILANKSERLSGTVPLSRLTVRNLATDQIIFKKESDDTPVSIYKVDMEELGAAFAIIWEAGSADRIEIFTVSENQVKNALSESYRIDASLIDLSGEARKDVLISTTDDQTGELIMKDFSWNGEKFDLVGKADYKKFVNTVKKSLNKK